MDTPDVIHGRMKEGAHIAGYSLQRAMENLRWLLEDSRFEQLASGHNNVNDFLRDTQDAFTLLNIKPEERKQIAELVKELQPKASQRAIGDLMGVSNETIAKDLGARDNVNLLTKDRVNDTENVNLLTPAIPPDDYDAVKIEQHKQGAEKRKQEKETKQQELIDKASLIQDSDRYTLHLGDIAEQGKLLEDESINLIITDPPYPEEYLPQWTELAKLASRVLKPSAFLISYSGQTHLFEVMQRLSKHLDYYWTMSLIHSGGNQLVGGRYAVPGWKPILIYQNTPFKRLDHVFHDVIDGTGREKDLHEWAQAVDELTIIIDYFSLPGQTILDPFAGSGTTLLASLQNDRLAIGIEIEEDKYKIARGRINEFLQKQQA